MARAMAVAPVGDDVIGEDPSINALEERVADMLGHDAALFCVSGTMANQIALRACGLGALDNLVCDSRAHIHIWEVGGIHTHCGAQVTAVTAMGTDEAREVAGEGAIADGRLLSVADVMQNVVTDHNLYHATTTKVVALENTLGGQVHNFRQMAQISDYLQRTNSTRPADESIALHLDGARFWNAVAAGACGVGIGERASDHGQLFDSISVCMSKGLGAPIGSMVVGSTALVNKSRHYRKLYGGAWRQGGQLAAACDYALDHHWPRMAQDHENAHALATGLTALGWELVYPVDTNMVFASPPKDFDFSGLNAKLKEEHGLLVNDVYSGGSTMRFVCHLQTPRHAIDRLLDALRREQCS
jgi:threonine aldolase